LATGKDVADNLRWASSSLRSARNATVDDAQANPAAAVDANDLGIREGSVARPFTSSTRVPAGGYGPGRELKPALIKLKVLTPPDG
jgi:hypothetical protein